MIEDENQWKNKRNQNKKQNNTEGICKKINVAEATQQRFEYGTVKPSLDTVILIAKEFNVSIDYLVGRTENPEVNK